MANVILKETSWNAMWFEIGKYSIFYYSRKKLWVCECRFEVFRGKNTDKECRHIKMAKKFLEDKASSPANKSIKSLLKSGCDYCSERDICDMLKRNNYLGCNIRKNIVKEFESGDEIIE